MSKAPYYSVFFDNNEKREITKHIDRIKFEEAIKEDDYLEITINPDFAWEYDHDEEFISGTMILFEFGFQGIESSGIRKARLSDITPTYGERLTISVKALDKGNVMKKSSSGKLWKNKTTKQIIEEIAADYGMTAICEIDGILHKSYPQGLKSDWLFLQELAEKEKDGDYIVYCRDNSIVLEKIGLEAKSIRTFTYKDPKSKIISFIPKQNESGSKPEAINATMVSYDPLTQKPIKSITKSTNANSSTGEFEIQFDEHMNKSRVKKAPIVQGDTKEDAILGNVQVIGKIQPNPPMSQNELNNKSKSQQKKNTLSNNQATLKIEGDPSMRVNKIITIDNVFKKHKGNWLIVKAIHEITTSGYITTLELERNGAKAGSKKYTSETKVNKSVGKDTSEPTKKKLVVFDGETSKRIQ